jgi:hypothetical protein
MNATKTSLLLLVYLLMTLVSCQAEVKTPTQIPSETSSPLTITPPIPSVMVTSAALTVKEICPTFAASVPLDIELHGVLVLDKSNDPQLGIGDAYLLSLENHDLMKINQPDEYVFSYAVSDDRTTLAYGVGSHMQYYIALTDGRGKLLKTIPRNEFFGIRKWLDNQQLFLNSSVLNVNSGEERLFHPEDFPNYSPDDIWQKGWFSLDPMLTRVVYPGFGGLAMVDLVTNQTLATVLPQGGSPQVAWSPDGSRVAIAGIESQENTTNPASSEIYIVTRDGQSNQATHLSDYYGYSNLYSPSWSPDGRYVAFWQPATLGLMLLVLDTTTENVTSYCNWENSIAIYPDPIWSPDGNQLLIGSLNTEDASRVLIIDLAKNIAFPIEDDAVPKGWLISP